MERSEPLMCLFLSTIYHLTMSDRLGYDDDRTEVYNQNENITRNRLSLVPLIEKVR